MRATGTTRGGAILSGLTILFLGFDALGKLIAVPQVIEGTTALGYPLSTLLPIGVIELVCLVLYLVPRTTVLGAVLLTGYLGGAVATHLRIGSPLLTHILFPTYVGTLVWLGLWLRDVRVRVLVPVRQLSIPEE
jgi:hypothetical protein